MLRLIVRFLAGTKKIYVRILFLVFLPWCYLPYLSNFPLDFFTQKIESCELQLITARKVANYFTL